MACSKESEKAFDVSKVKFKRHEGHNASEILNPRKSISIGNAILTTGLDESENSAIYDFSTSSNIAANEKEITKTIEDIDFVSENYVVIGTCEDMINGQEDQIFKSRERINLLINDNTELKNRLNQLERRLNTVINQKNRQDRKIENLEVENNKLDGLVEILKDEIK